jgi:hypothetical protein
VDVPELQSIVFVVEEGVGNEVGEKCYCGSTSLVPVAVLILLKTKQTFFRSKRYELSNSEMGKEVKGCIAL